MSDLPDEPTSAARGASEQIVFHKRLESHAHEYDDYSSTVHHISISTRGIPVQ